MNSFKSARMGPESTHPALKVLLQTLGLGALLSSFVREGIVLTLSGVNKGWLWELLSYPFALGAPLGWGPIAFLAVDLWVLWTFGSALIDQKGIKSFFLLFLASTLIGGLAALAGMTLAPSFLARPGPAVFALLAAWARLHPNTLFFGLRAAPILFGVLAIDLLIEFSREDWTHLFANGSAALFGFFFIALSFRAKTPVQHAKIYDIRSGKPVLDDDQFMDSMLAKISRYGENALTPDEKKRMLGISARKR